MLLESRKTASPLPLFREAAFARFRNSPWQQPLLSKPLSGLFIATSALLAMLALIAFATTFKFARKELAMGHLTPVAGWSRVSAQSFAVVHRRFVEAGDLVETGDVLYELASGDGLDAGVSVEARLLEELNDKRATLAAQLSAIQSQFENERALMKHERAATEQQVRLLDAEIRSHSARSGDCRDTRRAGIPDRLGIPRWLQPVTRATPIAAPRNDDFG